MNAIETLAQRMIIPVVSIERVEDAVPLAEALSEGGLAVAEITFRTPAAAQAIRMIRDRFPDFLVGAGTVTTADDLKAAVDSGACFAVAPGFNPLTCAAASDAGLPFFPGVCTPTEMELALAEGFTTLKFFPAETVGGVRALQAMSTPYLHRGVRYIATGGINSTLLPQYLAEKCVLAVGGSWMVAPALLRGGDWKRVRALTEASVASAREVRPEVAPTS